MGSESDPPDPSPVSLIGNLFNAILDSCVVSYQKSTSNEQSRRLRSEAERFFLWGDGVSATGGQLDKALDTSSELYQTALSALYELGKVVHDGLTKVVALEGVAGPVAGSHELQLLLEDVSVTLDTSNAIEDSESLSDGENGPYSLEDVLDDMATYIDCLMDLSLALEDALAHPKSVRFKPTVIEPIVIEPTDIELNHVRPAVGDSVVSSHQGIDVPELSSPAYGDAISLGIDDSGLPSFQATITLFDGTPQERVVYLGPWEVQESNPRRVTWQGSYQNEALEHYFPSNDPSDLHPHTLHTRHRPFVEPEDTERYVTFREPHRIRYTNDEGVCIHDEAIAVKYEFTSAQASIQFQGDLRRKDLVDFFDTDVAWTNVHSRTDSFGNIRGLATIQRLKIWRDRSTGLYSLSLYENRVNGQNHDYSLDSFHTDVGRLDDRARQLRLRTLHQDREGGRRPITAYQIQPQRRRINLSGPRRSEPRPSESIQRTDDMQYLGIQFSDRGAYRRFLDTWAACHGRNSEPQYQPGPPSQFRLPSRNLMSKQSPQDRPQIAIDLTPDPSTPADATGSQRQQQ